MNLTTHWAVALALGIGIFHNVEIALVMSIGALIPDLDREYVFVVRNFIARHQLHRSLFHNFFVILILYFVNPFLALGALTHSLLDMFTSASDRGAEVLYPLTRIVNGYYYKIDGQQATQPAKKIQWWVEDPWSLLKDTSDLDLQEPTQQPWRRSYGPFKNSRLVDWGIFFASLLFIVISYFASGGSLFSMIGFNEYSMIPLVGIAIFYGLGEWWRRKSVETRPEKTNWLVLIILLGGLVVFFYSGYLYLLSPPHLTLDLALVSYGVVSTVVGFLASFAFIKLRKKYPDKSL